MKNNCQFGLVIGRFQPPSLHHFDLFKQVINYGVQKLIIVVGDSQKIDSRNFLTAEDVKSLLIPSLDNLNFPYQIVVVPDINNPPKYANHVMNFLPQINESNTCLFTENTYTSDCFTNYGHSFKIVKPKISPIHATIIRQLMVDNNPDWQKFVPKNVAEYIIKASKKP